MQLPVQITFRNVQSSPAVEQHVRRRAEKLDRFAPRLMGCRVVFEMPHRHAHHGQSYRVRIDLTLPGGEIVVAHAPKGAHVHEDAHGAVDAAFREAVRRLKDFVGRRRAETA